MTRSTPEQTRLPSLWHHISHSIRTLLCTIPLKDHDSLIPNGSHIVTYDCPKYIEIDMVVIMSREIPETNVSGPGEIGIDGSQPRVIGLDNLADLLQRECTGSLICIIGKKRILGAESANSVRDFLTILADGIQTFHCTSPFIHRSGSAPSSHL